MDQLSQNGQQSLNIRELQWKYESLNPRQRLEKIYQDFGNVLVTSSFGASSSILLQLLSEVNPGAEVLFIDTGYHFEETLEFKAEVCKKLRLEITELKAEDWKHEFTTRDKTWKKDSDLCCSINKVEPLERIKRNYQVWISGLMGFQNLNRRNLGLFEQKEELLKAYPLIDVLAWQVDEFMERYQLPVHPLRERGFESIGCKHCTLPGQNRDGRWSGKGKTECGLH